ncbi:MAG: hypothetical protein ABII16_03550, partial [Patescibacteria group bacterium]
MIPNTTPTPNELYNGEMVKMNDTELRIVLTITRATLGWEIDKETGMRKKEDWISYYQLKQKTGRCFTAIAKAIQSCIEKGWIETRNKDGELLNTKSKRIGRKIFYRLGRIFLDKIEIPTSPQSEEVEIPTSPQSVITESVITESEAYKRNTIQNKTNTNDCETIVSPLKQSLKPEEKKDFTDQPFSFKQSLEGMQASDQRHLQIIALYWQFKNIIAENKDQYATLLGKELKAARDLKGFSDKQITEIMEYLEHN